MFDLGADGFLLGLVELDGRSNRMEAELGEIGSWGEHGVGLGRIKEGSLNKELGRSLTNDLILFVAEIADDVLGRDLHKS